MQCTAKSQRSKERCRKHAIAGANVCRNHGGAVPQVRAAANIRLALERLVDPAIRELERILRSPKTPLAVKLRAACDVLDRNGLTAPREIAITIHDLAKLSDDELRMVLLRLGDELEGSERYPLLEAEAVPCGE
jgi:hypothetical protein